MVHCYMRNLCLISTYNVQENYLKTSLSLHSCLPVVYFVFSSDSHPVAGLFEG